MGVCQDIIVQQVLADQSFSCVGTVTSIPLGVSLPAGSTVSSIAFTQIQADCAAVFDAVTNQVEISFSFTLSADVTISTIPVAIPVSGLTLACTGTFCGVTADMFPVTEQALIDCELVQVAGITHTDDSLDFVNDTLTTTISIISRFALVQKATITVAICSGKSGATVIIPSTPCRDDSGEIDRD